MRIKEGILPPSLIDSLILSEGLEFLFTYQNETFEYIYEDDSYTFLSIQGSFNNDKLLIKVYGPNYDDYVSELWGRYPEGEWPQWEDEEELIILLRDMELRGVKITIS